MGTSTRQGSVYHTNSTEGAPSFHLAFRTSPCKYLFYVLTLQLVQGVLFVTMLCLLTPPSPFSFLSSSFSGLPQILPNIFTFKKITSTLLQYSHRTSESVFARHWCLIPPLAPFRTCEMLHLYNLWPQHLTDETSWRTGACRCTCH